MMDPLRLLETSHGGLERELLRSALTEVAPEAVRARVLASVSEVLANTASVASSASTAAPSGFSKLALALKSAKAIYLAGAVAITAGAGAAAHYLTRAGVVEATPQSQIRRIETPANVAAMPTEERPAEAVPQQSAQPPAPGDKASSGPSTARAPVTAASKAGRAVTPNATTSAQTADELGDQLTLLSEARQHLKSGKLDAAARQLDRYEQRFPRGVLTPEVEVLRARVREQRTARIPLPRASQP